MSTSPGVLVCDDARFARALIGRTLGDAGFTIVGEAADGLEAVRLFESLRPALVTMDIVMPGRGGLDALRAIRRIDPAARVVMCSAINHPPLVQEALDAGARDFVAKPFHPAGLLDAVKRSLR